MILGRELELGADAEVHIEWGHGKRNTKKFGCNVNGTAFCGIEK
jgi:hypothetical protein